MRRVIHLKFTAEVETEAEAWAIAEQLEQAATARNYRAVSGWVESDGSREGILVAEGEVPPTTEAMRIERAPGNAPTAIGADASGGVSPVVWGSQD